MGDTEKTRSVIPSGERIAKLEVRVKTLESEHKSIADTVKEIRDEVIGIRPFTKVAVWSFGLIQVVLGGLIVYALSK